MPPSLESEQTLRPRLQKDSAGRLIWIDESGVEHAGAYIVRAYPLTAPDENISVMSAQGTEIHFFPSMSAVPQSSRAPIEEALAAREFMPVILRIKKISRNWVPSVWDIDTDRGATRLKLDSEEDIRRIGQDKLIVRDSRGISFSINDYQAMDHRSRRMLDRFL